MEHREALYVLNMLPFIGPCKRRLLENEFGSIESAFAADISALQRVPGMGEKLAGIVHNWERYCDLKEELRMCRDGNVRLITDEDDEYPPLLRSIHDPPICLYMIGEPDALRESSMSLGIVGSRNASMYGMRIAASMGTGAAVAGWPVISGLARGIDTAAHEAAVSSGGRTVAVIGSGLLNIYPRENVMLAARIAESGGAVITEWPMRYRPDRRSFPMRNRIISGISRGTLVVEAGIKSGSLITAASALEQGRTVFAVPGAVDGPFSRGCHALIKDGAVLVETFQDIIDEFTGLPGLARPPRESQARPPAIPDESSLGLSGLEKKIRDLVAAGVCDMDGIISSLEGDDVPCIMASIMTLRLKRVIRQLPAGRLEVGS